MLDFDVATKRFGPVMALDRCAFSVRPGRLTGFLGPNGAGKTTAMRAVFGLVDLDEGAVRWHGRPVRPADRARFGYMPEERGLYPRMRVRDQLTYLGQLCGRGPGHVHRSVDSWLERLGLAGRAADRLDALSHGNQQRVQLTLSADVDGPAAVRGVRGDHPHGDHRRCQVLFGRPRAADHAVGAVVAGDGEVTELPQLDVHGAVTTCGRTSSQR